MAIDQYKLTYHPAPSVPQFFIDGLKNIGGINPFGEPNLQIVWGMDARVFRRGNPNAIKYLGKQANELGMPAFIVEEYWRPERFGNEFEWEQHRYFRDDSGKLIDAIGEYPSRGRHYMMHGGLLMNENGLPSALTESTLEYVAILYKGRLAPATTAEDNARRYREMLDKQAELEAAQRKEMAEIDNAEWERMRLNWDKAKADTTREFSFVKKGNLFLPNQL